jgi:hypothetical protein
MRAVRNPESRARRTAAGTYTQDPDFWNQVIKMAQQRGHEIKCVTMRFPDAPIDVPCEAKRKFYQADVWIDDQPYFVDMDADQAIAVLAALQNSENRK